MYKTVFFMILSFQMFLLAQTKNITGKWESNNEEYNYIVKYDIFVHNNGLYGKLFYAKSQGEEWEPEEGDEPIILIDFNSTDSKTYSGTYYDLEEDEKYEAIIKVKNNDELELTIPVSEGKFKETLIRIK